MTTKFTPTAIEQTIRNGKTVTLTEWWLGEYALRLRAADGEDNAWEVRCNQPDLPPVVNIAEDWSTPEFGIECDAWPTLPPIEASDWAGKIMAAATIAEFFTDIVTQNS